MFKKALYNVTLEGTKSGFGVIPFNNLLEMKEGKILSLLKTGLSTENYYKTFNKVYLNTFGEYYMLHYPFYRDKEDDFLQCQKNLTDYCIDKVGKLEGKKVLEVGCGNGIQAIYVMKKYKPAEIIGIDLNENNIRIAKEEALKQGIENVKFYIDNAHTLSMIEDNSVDIVMNIESAFHYPDKEQFIKQIYRVLKPGGKFVIADIIKKYDEKRRKGFWKRRMHFHHGSETEYRKMIEDANFKLNFVEDITDHVIESFNICIKWFKKSRVIKNVFTRIWGMIMLRLNAHLLRKKQSYFIFAGEKPSR